MINDITDKDGYLTDEIIELLGLDYGIRVTPSFVDCSLITALYLVYFEEHDRGQDEFMLFRTLDGLAGYYTSSISGYHAPYNRPAKVLSLITGEVKKVKLKITVELE